MPSVNSDEVADGVEAALSGDLADLKPRAVKKMLCCFQTAGGQISVERDPVFVVELP